MTLVFPKWIPGNHRPSGPIAALTGIHMEADGKPLLWQRDDVDMYAFHVTVPGTARAIDVSLDAITTNDSAGGGGPAASSNILDLNWNAVVLYPQGADSDAVEFAASVKLPAGWKFGTALTPVHSSGDDVEFAPVSLSTLVDSPLIAGLHFRRIELTSAPEIVHEMDLVADNETDLAMTPEDLAAYKKLVAETGALFGARHYRQYHFLYTLSDQVGGHGLEHHESNDSATSERTLLDPDLRMLNADLLPTSSPTPGTASIAAQRAWLLGITRSRWPGICCGFTKVSPTIWVSCWRSVAGCCRPSSIARNWPQPPPALITVPAAPAPFGRYRAIGADSKDANGTGVGKLASQPRLLS